MKIPDFQALRQTSISSLLIHLDVVGDTVFDAAHLNHDSVK